MHKYLKKLLVTITFLGIFSFISFGFKEYILLNWDLSISAGPVNSVFNKFKHIKYPQIFSSVINKNKLSSDTIALKSEINNLDQRIVKIFGNASSLFYLDYLPVEPIEKKFAPINPMELASLLDIKEPSLAFISIPKDVLSLNSDFSIQKIKIEDTKTTIINWESFYEEAGLEAEILAYDGFFEKKILPTPNQEDAIKIVQSSTQRSSKNILQDEKDDLVFFSYKEEKDEEQLSSSVLKAIEREMKKKSKPKASLATNKTTVGGYTISKGETESPSALIKSQYKAQSKMLEAEVVAIGVKIDQEIVENISGIEFVPHYDKNERVYDEAEGILKLTSNTEKSNFIYGTLLGKDYVNMRVSIPLFLGGGMFEAPLLEKQALNKLLDKEKLKGIGSFLLIDLGENAIDVDIDKQFEARTFLNDDFKVVTGEDSYRYILYVGVTSGNAVLRYLDSKGSTQEKLTFLAESELTFEYFKQKDTFSFRFDTFELNPLSKEAKELGMSSKNISLFGKKISPKQIGLNTFEFERHSGLSSSNSYLEFNHLGESIFAGMRYSNYVILPSAKFIESILKAEDVGNLENNCMIQLNLSKPVKTILFDGEDRMGPMDVRLHYLDEDGVLSEEPSMLTKHAFLVGIGQGVINMRVEFLDESKLVAQSFCSDGTYLVEQL